MAVEVLLKWALDEIKKSLDEEHISYEEFGGCKTESASVLCKKRELKKRLLWAELILQ